MAAPPIVLCTIPGHEHALGSPLIIDILFASNPVHNLTCYEVLRYPMFKTHAQHVVNHANIQAELGRVGCICPRAGALAAVNAAWALIATPAAKVAYDNAQNAVAPPPIINAAGNIPPGPPPIRFNIWGYVSVTYEPSAFGWLPSRMPPYGNNLTARRVLNPLSREFKNVEGRPNQLWRKLDAAHSYCRRTEYSFWFALSLAMYTEEFFWAEIKSNVKEWYAWITSVPPPVPEPRVAHYLAMEDYASRRVGTVRPLSSTARQLDPDGLGASGPVGANGLHTGEVGPEMWQFVADCYSIELFVIIAHRHPGQRHHKIIPRGDHNNRQVFLFLEEDGQYHGVLPVVDDPFGFRFIAHMPDQLVGTPKNAVARAGALAQSNEMRCPYLQVDIWNIPLVPAVPIPTVVGVNVPAGTPIPVDAPLWPYVPPFGPFLHIAWDANVNPNASLFPLASRHFNPSSGRWI